MDPEMEERIIKWLDDNYLGYNEYEYNLPTDGFLRKAGTKISVLLARHFDVSNEASGFPHRDLHGVREKAKKSWQIDEHFENVLKENKEKNELAIKSYSLRRACYPKCRL